MVLLNSEKGSILFVMEPTYIIWGVGVVLVIVGELWAVFNKADGDTITETLFRHPVSLSAMGALIMWCAWHFFVAQGNPGWYDLIFLIAGAGIGIVVWYFNRREKGKRKRLE